MIAHRLTLAFATLVAVSPLWAYEVETHDILSRRAYSTSDLSGDATLHALGVRFDEYFVDSEGSQKKLDDLIRFGARFEDGAVDEPCSSRPKHHFFDPVHDRPLSYSILSLGIKSPDWALEDRDDLPDQEFSLRHARDYLFDALTTVDVQRRRESYGLMFQSLGQIVHHIEDMAQPQHVRNDMHLAIPENASYGCQLLNLLKDPSLYEQYTHDRGENIPGGFYADVMFAKARDFWATETQGANRGTGAGLAEFTNNNFVSKDTNFALLPDGSVSPNAEYVLPALGGLWESKSLAQLLSESNEPAPCRQDASGTWLCLQGEVDFYWTTVTDHNTGSSATNTRATSLSVFDQYLTKYNTSALYINDPDDPDDDRVEYRIFTLNRFNFDKAHQYLVPRAVGYSAGFINYFFRGRLKAEDARLTDTGMSLRIVNDINITRFPKLKDEILYAKKLDGSPSELVLAFSYKDANGMTHYGRSTNTVTLAAGDEEIAPGATSKNSYSFNFTIPDSAVSIAYRLAYHGRLGAEDGAVAFGKIVPTSGFVIQTYLASTNGWPHIFRQTNKWRLDEQPIGPPTIVAANIDWKGAYGPDGKPTKTLSWHGPFSRYFPVDANVSVPDRGAIFLSIIYKDGEPFSATPGIVLGAAITQDSSGKEWLIAICTDLLGGDTVYRRPAKRGGSHQLYHPVTNPDGWVELGRFPRIPGTVNPDRPWFFNGSGTEAQTLRAYDHLSGKQFSTARLRVTIADAISANREQLPDEGPIQIPSHFPPSEVEFKNETPTCSPASTVTFQELYHVRSEQFRDGTGEYVIAVDFINNQLVEAKFSIQFTDRSVDYRHNQRDITYTYDNDCKIVGSSDTRTEEYSYTYNQNNVYQLVMPGRTVDFHAQTSSTTEDHWTHQDSISTMWREIFYMDLRYNVLVSRAYTSASTSSGGLQNGNYVGNISGTLVDKIEAMVPNSPASTTLRSESSQGPLNNHDFKLAHDQPINTTGSDMVGQSTVAFSFSNGNWLANWATDSSGNVVGSHEYERTYAGNNQWNRKFYRFLSNGELNQVLPALQDNSVIYGVGALD